MFRVLLVPSDMVLIYVCLVFLQLAACSSRTTDRYESEELSKSQISKLILPLLDSNARKNDIKVQVVPYYNYKNKKRGKNDKSSVATISRLGENRTKKKDLPVTVILADPKYMKRARKVSSEESHEHVTDIAPGVKVKRQFTKAPFWANVADNTSEEDSLSDSSLIIEVNKNDAKVSKKAIEEESSESYSDDSITSESTDSEYEHPKKGLKTVNSIDIAKSSEDSKSSEGDVKPFNNFHHAPIEKPKHNDTIIKSSNKYGNLESNKNILHSHEDHEHVTENNHNISRSIISKSDNITNKEELSEEIMRRSNNIIKHSDIIRKKRSSEESSEENLLSLLKSHNRSEIDNKDNHHDNIFRSLKSLEDSKSIENDSKLLKNHERSHINEQGHNILVHVNYSDHEPSEIHKHSDTLIKSTKSSESLEGNEDRMGISQLSHDISLSHNAPNNSDHDPVSIHKHTDNIIRQGKSSEDLKSKEVISPAQDSSQINKRSDDDLIPHNSEIVRNINNTAIQDSKTLEDSVNLDVSDSHLQGSRHHHEGHDNNSSDYLRNGNKSLHYYEDASGSASEYDLSESSSEDDNVEKNGNNLVDETAENFVTDIPLANSYDDIETIKYKLDDSIQPQLSLKVGSKISEQEGQPIAFINGAKFKKLEIKDKSDEIFLGSHSSDNFLNPVENDYPVERSGIKESIPMEELDDSWKLLEERSSKSSDSSDENSKEKLGRRAKNQLKTKNEHILLAPNGIIDEEEYTGKQIFDAIKSYIKKAHDLNSKSYNLSFLFNK